MSDDLLNVYQEVKETFQDRIQDNEDLADDITGAIVELSDKEMTDAEKIRSVVEEVQNNEDP